MVGLPTMRQKELVHAHGMLELRVPEMNPWEHPVLRGEIIGIAVVIIPLWIWVAYKYLKK